LVSLSPIAQKLIAEKIEKDINNPEVTVRAVNEKFLLEGAVTNKDEYNRAEIIAKTYVPDMVVDKAEGGWIKKPKVDLVINLLTIKEAAPPPPGKIIQLVFHYVELNKDYTKGFRFQWTPDISDGSKVEFGSTSRTPGSVISSIAGTVSNLLPKLNWAKQHGHARVLQSSSLIVEAGKEGILNSTTKVPYQVINQNGVPGTQFQDVGIQAKVTPRILGDSSDSVNLEMNFSISSLIGITDAGPMTSNSQVQTVVAVRSGQSAAIGGLISNSQSTGYNRLPKNSSDNPLISLYASKDFNRKQSQFVVFITPIIKSSASSGSEKIKKKFHLRD
jgi:pilus assembly protein CpaC